MRARRLKPQAYIPRPDGEAKAYFVGIAGEWHFIPADLLEQGKVAVGYAGITLAGLSLAQTVFQKVGLAFGPRPSHYDGHDRNWIL